MTTLEIRESATGDLLATHELKEPVGISRWLEARSIIDPDEQARRLLVVGAEDFSSDRPVVWVKSFGKPSTIQGDMKRPFVREPLRTHYRYRPDYDIRNLDQLPAGTGARFLVCIEGEGGTLVAKRWARKRNCLNSPAEITLDFGQERIEI